MNDSRIARPAIPPLTDVFEAARRVGYEYIDHATDDSGVPALAAKMGMPAGTLYNKLNPHESAHHKLTLQDAIQISAITGDLRILQALSRTLGCVCFPVPNLAHVSDEALLELVNNIGAEGGDFYRTLNSALANRRCRARELAAIHKEGMEFISAIVETMERMKGLIDV